MADDEIREAKLQRLMAGKEAAKEIEGIAARCKQFQEDNPTLGAGAAERVERMERMNWARKIEMPAWFLKLVEHDTLRVDPSWEAIKALIADNGVVAMVGPPGTGKTTIACWLLWERGSGIITTATRWVMLPTWEHQHRPETATSLLVLDDLGREPADKRIWLEELLYLRWDAGLATLITSNLEPDEFRDAYDGRLVSRIERAGAMITLTEAWA